MRTILRHLMFTAGAVFILQAYVNPFEFGGSFSKTFFIVIAAMTLIIYLTRPLLKIISFPVGGVIYTLLLTLVIGAGFYALESFIPEFAIKAFDLPPTTLFGIMLGNAHLQGLQAIGFVSAFTAVFLGIVGWVMG